MRKGFTLVELLAVVIILGILVVISIPPVMQNLDKSRTASYEQLMATIEQTTQLYIRNNKDYIDGVNVVDNTFTITLQDLVTSENFKTPVIDPITEREIALTTPISILVKPLNKYKVTIGTIIYVE